MPVLDCLGRCGPQDSAEPVPSYSHQQLPGPRCACDVLCCDVLCCAVVWCMHLAMLSCCGYAVMPCFPLLSQAMLCCAVLCFVADSVLWLNYVPGRAVL